MPVPLPPLKAALDVVELMHEGKPMVLLRDQEGLNEQTMALSPAGFFIAIMLNGQNSLADVQKLFSDKTGTILKETDIQDLVDQLDKAGFLETAALAARRRHVLEEFSKSKVRKPQHLDGFNSSDPLAVSSELAVFFQGAKGPGKQFSSAPAGNAPLGLVSPHIDFHRGGPAYAWAYQALSEAPAPDLIVALGVAHMSPNSPWVMTPKAYETPYGPMAVAADLYDEFKKVLWYEPTSDEWVHRTEHSLEFQAFWLRYLWKDKTPPWLPILCSSFEQFCPDKAPSTISTINDALERFGEKLKERRRQGQKIMILAGIDLAHVGPRFGDQEKLGPELFQRIEKEDRASLEHAMNLSADDFYLSVVADKHWRKVCGLSALYSALRLMKIMSDGAPAKGQLLTYGQEPDPMGGIVSFASAIYR